MKKFFLFLLVIFGVVIFSGNAHAANEIYGQVKNSVDDFPVENADVWYCTSTVPEEFPTCVAEFIGRTNQDGAWKLLNPIPNYYYRIWATKEPVAYSQTETFYYSGGSHYGGILGMTGISQTLGITVLEPNKDCVATGKPVQPVTIQWSTTIANSDHFTIGYIESDVAYHSITEVPGNLRSYAWTPPVLNNVWARIAVIAQGSQGQFLGQDFSDIPLQLSLSCPTITLQTSNIRVTNITDTAAHVQWETNLPAISTVEYKIGTLSRSNGFATSVTSTPTTSHDTLLTYLLPNTTYYFYIRLWDSLQNEVRTETVPFKTASRVEAPTSSVEIVKPAPKAEICYTCPQPVVSQPETIGETQQQPQPETKEVTRELQGKIQEFVLKLQDQIKALQTQIAELNTQVQSQGQELVAVKLELQFTKTIQRGTKGEDVQKLQEFLRSFPDVYPEGVVSGYFGPMTEVAVKRFQEKNGLEPVGVVGPKTRAALNAQSSANGNCANSTARPCYDRVTLGKTVGLAAKAGENSLQACLRSKSPSLRGTGHTKTTLSELESYQYCFEGKSTVQIRFFAGSTGSPIVPSLKPKLPKLSCTQAPEFSTLGWLDPGAPWSISEPSRIIDGYYIYSFVVDTMLKTKSGTLFAAGYGINSSDGWTLVVHKSTDNGVSWSSIKLPDVQPNWGFVHSMAEDHNGVLYAGGTGFWKSTDGGNTWTSLPMPYPDTYYGGFVPIYRMVIAKDNSLLAAFGAGYSGTPKVYRRIDGGGIWSELFSHTYLITSIVEADDGSLVFRDTPSSTEGGVYRYSNGTTTKTFTDYIGGTGEPTAGLLKARDGALYLVSIDKSVDINTIEYTEPGHAFLAAYKSTNNGITWIKQGTLPNSWTMQGPVIEASDGAFYVASYSVCDKRDAVYKSTDKGVTWSIIGASPTFGNINPDLWYYFVIRDIIEVSGNVLIGGNAPVIFMTR